MGTSRDIVGRTQMQHVKNLKVPQVSFSSFIVGIFDDWRIIIVGIANVCFFILCAVGLQLVPYGNDKIPASKLAVQGTICCWSLFSGLICLIGSAARNRSVLLCSMVFIGHVIATLTCGAFMLAETLYTCRHCAGLTSIDCKGWYSDCDAAYGVYLFGAVGTLVCQYLMLYLANDRRDNILKDLVEANKNQSS
eukprot:c12663_g1_i1.p1 GENE.c12663_g1_i1~~c12663_g1_i1.p1  ORF type:complete len:193 (-),score=49.37 c12663_g1_i1:74-652(-)